MIEKYDITIIGSGPAGAFATYKAAVEKTDQKVCVVEFGRPPGKRRKQMEGWFGCFMSSNLRFYTDDLIGLNSICGDSKSEYDELLDFLKTINKTEIVKQKEPSDEAKNRIVTNGYTYKLNPYFQWQSENVHLMSKKVAAIVESNKNITCKFDTECFNVEKTDGGFFVVTEHGKFFSKNVVVCAGRSGWRFAHKVFKNLGISTNNNKAAFGVRIEIPVSTSKLWNGSHCTMFKDDTVIGPLSWNGTVVPEDHDDLVISNWRSNEDRWYSEKMSFVFSRTFEFHNNGKEQSERLSKLAYVLSDSRVGKIKVKEYNGNWELNMIPEYKWLRPSMLELKCLFNGILEKGVFHAPEVTLNIPDIDISNKLETNIKGLYVAGETAGVSGLLGSAVSGIVVANNLLK